MRTVSKKEFDPSDYPKEGTASICCSFFLFLLFVPVVMLFFYHVAPTTVMILMGFWFLATVVPWLYHAGGTVTSDVSGPLLTVILFISVALAFLNSVRCYYQHSQPMRQLATSRQYAEVYPELPAAAFPDAAYIEFAKDTKVDASKAISFQTLDSGLSTFCVAPIVGPASQNRHNFWAIGIDCCGKEGEKFECYDAGEPDVRTAWVLPNTLGWDRLFASIGVWVSLPEQRRDLFAKAVKKAEATYEVVTPGDDVVLVRWTKRSKEDIVKWEFIGVLVTVFFTAAWQILVSLCMTRLYQRFQNLRKIHSRQANASLEAAADDEQVVTARLQNFINDARAGADDADFGGISDLRNRLSHVDIEKFRPPLNGMDVCLWGVLMPWLLFVACVIVSSLAPCMRFSNLVVAPFGALTTILILSLLATPNRMVLGCFLMLVCSAGYYIGGMNYKQNMFHYCSTSDRRLYKAVHADTNPDVYRDAGTFHFEKSSILSPYHSAGFLYEGVTYCAAPVISRKARCLDVAVFGPSPAPGPAPAPAVDFLQLDANRSHAGNGVVLHKDIHPHRNQRNLVSTRRQNETKSDSLSFMQRRSNSRQSRRARSPASPAKHVNPLGCKKIAPAQVEFWAIGIDCCDARNKFWCDGGEDTTAHQAVVVRAYGVDDRAVVPEAQQVVQEMNTEELKARSLFFKAVSQSVAAFDLPIPEVPILLRWGRSSKELQLDWRKNAFGLIIMTSISSLILLLIVGFGGLFFLRQNRRLERKEVEDYAQRMGGAGQSGAYPSSQQSLPPATMG